MDLLKWVIMWTYWIYVNIELLARFSDLVISKICITKIDWIKPNFPSKCSFKSDEDKNKYSLISREESVKFDHTLSLLILIFIKSSSLNELQIINRVHHQFIVEF